MELLQPRELVAEREVGVMEGAIVSGDATVKGVAD